MAVTSVIDLNVERYQRHALHATERIWNETNCYVDVWIEVLHALGMEPLAASAFALDTDFEGDQWTFFKFPPEDLRELFGISVFEMNPWRPLLDHVLDHLERGRLITVEVDSWYLPDTAGVSYRLEHTKTTVVPNAVDPLAKRLGYFHGASYYELAGEDFDGVFRLGDTEQAGALPPYVETIRLDGMRAPDAAELRERSRAQLALHIARAPQDNPIERLRDRLNADRGWLREAGVDGFHKYAFGTCRQCGASAEVAAEYLRWVAQDAEDRSVLEAAAADFRAISEGCKSLEFSLARVASGRTTDFTPTFDQMAAHWASAMAALRARNGG